MPIIDPEEGKKNIESMIQFSPAREKYNLPERNWILILGFVYQKVAAFQQSIEML